VFQYAFGVTSESAAAAANAADRLGAALRALADVVVRTAATDDELEHAAEQVERLADELGAAGPRRRVHDSPFHPMSLVGGAAHPTAPQLHTAPTEDGVAGTVVLGPAYEGGPGLAHGGILSLLFDHAMGQALFVAGHSAMTVSLEVRYRRPTPLGVPLAVSAKVAGRQGRKLFVEAQVAVAGQLTAEARGVFVQLTSANVAQIFPTDRVPPDPPPGEPRR
jgi:acyl-coenzyme A thioesterase PaaI-like protein